MEGNPLILVSEEQKTHVPSEVLQSLTPVVVASADELATALTGGFDSWSDYRDRVIGKRQEIRRLSALQMAHTPAQLSTLLQKLPEELSVILGRNLVGVYLYGSLTQRAFNPKRSDVDCVVVTERNLSDAQFRQLDTCLARLATSNPWTARLQMSFLTKSRLFTENRRACLYQFGVLTRSGSDGNSIIWRNIQKSGVVLFGARPETFVPAITPEMLYQSLERELGYLREEITSPKSVWRDVPFYRVYAVLTLCRILYTFKKGTVASKPVAARWALKHLPQSYHEVIRRAVEFCATQDVWRDDAKRSPRISLSRIERFIDFADAQLHSA